MAKLEDRYYPKLPNMCKNSPKKLRLERKQIGGDEEKEAQKKIFWILIQKFIKGQIFFLKVKGVSKYAKLYCLFSKTGAMMEVKWAKGKYLPSTDFVRCRYKVNKQELLSCLHITVWEI